MSAPSGTTMEGMIWNANHVLDLALTPGLKKDANILEDAKAVILLTTVDVGVVFAGTRGSGVVLVKKEDGSWSAPSAVTLTSLKLGWIIGAEHKSLLMVFTEDKAIDNFLEGASIQVGTGMTLTEDEFMAGNDSAKNRGIAANGYVTTKGKGSVFVYTYKTPPSFEGMSMDCVVTLNSHTKANDRFYGKSVNPADIKGDVEFPQDSGIPELHQKLAALEANQEVAPTPDAEAKKESLRKNAEVKAESAKVEMASEIETVTASETSA